MDVSTHSLPGTIHIRRRTLLGLIAAAAAGAAALTGVIVALAVGGGSTAAVASPLGTEAQAYVNNVPLMPVIPGARVVANGATARTGKDSAYVRSITSQTPVQLVEAYGTDTQAAIALASLTPQQRLHIEAIMTMTPAQLRAAFGTGT
jgi:hypothetical protein